MKKSYVTSFPGRRDAYQLPVALAERGRLAAFATCFYRGRGFFGSLSARTGLARRRFASRCADGIPPGRVTCLELTNLAARLGQRLLQPSKVAVWEDMAFARAAVRLARAKVASLILYEFQADWAFQQPLAPGAKKILFQFHPHPDLEHPLLLGDAQRYPEFLPSVRRNTRANLGPRYREHTRSAWRHADHVIVASRFTARSLEVAGCPADRITVVPYGCGFAQNPAAPIARARAGGRPYFLFVGSGTHRKGLHHLLEAWTESTTRHTHDLVVVARVVDRELRPRLAAAPSVRHLAGVAARELPRLFAEARAFVLPSMSEGFGHVFLEALACGCPVIGTRNSMLPDFAAAQPHIRYVEPGYVAGIRQALDDVATLPATDPFFSTTAIRASVGDYTWQRFRDGVEAVLARFDGDGPH